MNTINTTARLISAVAAAGATLVLLSVVVSISEPLRSELLAHQRAVPVADTRVAAASVVTGAVRP